MKFDMHCHTKEGSIDGSIRLEDTISLLKEKGYDGMLITDHNSYRAHRHYTKHLKNVCPEDFIVLRGIEYDTLDCGHILVILPTGVRSPLMEIRGLPVSLLIEIVHHHGGILGPAHPCGDRFLSITNTRNGKKRNEIYKKFDFVETFNACESEESNEKAAALADSFDKPHFGGSDSHRENCVGLAYTIIDAQIRTESDLIDAVKNGAVVRSGGCYYKKTAKNKLKAFHHVLIYGFWFYNKLSAGWRYRRRHVALNNNYIFLK